MLFGWVCLFKMGTEAPCLRRPIRGGGPWALGLAGAKESRKPARAASKALLAPPLGFPHPWLQSKTPKEGFPP